MKTRQFVLMILDGVGLNSDAIGNAFAQAHKPNLDCLLNQYKYSRIKTSGAAVGLPEGQMGNSEVGHTNIGAGRIVYQELTRISKAIKDGDFFENEAFVGAMNHVKQHNSALHLMGLLSDGGVHSHQEHLYALLKMAKNSGVGEVYIHVFIDGRDTGPNTALNYLNQLELQISDIGIGKIATVSGRYYAMDRDNRWNRVQLAYDAIMTGKGGVAKSASEVIQKSYSQQISDEFIVPTVIVDENNNPLTLVGDDDAIIYFNYRPDRARQLTRAITDVEFNGFDRSVVHNNLYFVTMTEYDSSMKNIHVAYKAQALSNTFGEYISNLGYSQLRIAETEKYAHVTFFFNGGEEKQYEHEDRILIQSPQVATYDMAPAMSAIEVTDRIVDDINAKKHDVIIVNYANGDMVGHTGDIDKTIEAVEVLDRCVGRVVSALEAHDGEAIITADHGNCEYMIDPNTGSVVTSHSTFDVPMIVVSNRVSEIRDGRLCDIAPTLLSLMDEPIPPEMTGVSCIDLK